MGKYRIEREFIKKPIPKYALEVSGYYHKRFPIKSLTKEEAKEEMDIIERYLNNFVYMAGVARANYNEIFPSEEESADRWFKCKLWFITLDEKSGAEKRTAFNVLVQAADLRDAIKKLDEGMKETLADYVIASVSETAIMDVYPYEADPDVKPEFNDADRR